MIDRRYFRSFRMILLMGLVLLALLVALVPYYIHIHFIGSELSRAVFASTGRTLTLKKGPRIVLLPRPAVLLDEVKLSEPGSSQLFSAATSARIGLSFFSLLRGEVAVNSLELEAPELIILRDEKGEYNFEDLLSSKGMGFLKFVLKQLIFKNATFYFSDQFLGKNLKLTSLNLKLTDLTDPKTGMLSLNGLLSAGTKTQEDQALWWQGEMTAHAAVRYDEEKRRIRLADLEVNLLQQGESGSTLQLKDTLLSIQGDLIYDWGPFRLSGGDLSIKATAQRASQRWQAELILPEIKVNASYLDLNDLQFSSQMESPLGMLSTRFSVAQLSGATGKLLKTANASISVRLRTGGQNLTLDMVSPAELQNGTQLRLTDYHLTGSYDNKALTKKMIPFHSHGIGFLDLNNEIAELNSQGEFDRSPFRLHIALNNFLSHRYNFNLDVARVDLAAYGSDAKHGTLLFDQKNTFDFSWLEQLNAIGSIHIGELWLQKMKINDLSFDLKAANKKLLLNRLKAKLYGGTLTGRAEMDIRLENRAYVPTFKIQQQLNQIDLHALMYSLAGIDRLEGRGFFNLDLYAKGINFSDWRQTVSGNALIRVNDGIFRGIDIEGLLRAAHMQANLKSHRPKVANPIVPISDRTWFQELKAQFSISQGLANNKNLRILSPIFSIQGMGYLDLKENTIDYLLNASGRSKSETDNMTRLPLPIEIFGPLTSPGYKTNYTAFKEHIVANQKRKNGQTQARPGH